MTLEYFNQLEETEGAAQLTRCCGARKWVRHMLKARPFSDAQSLFDEAEKYWKLCKREDYLEAFEQHPKIGDLKSLQEKFASTKAWASGEQSGVESAKPETILHLAEGNRFYEDKFGHIFIVCATGKSAQEMLGLLNERLLNEADQELHVAAEEQMKITRIRLQKMLL